MTLPDESISALDATRAFFRDLLDPKATPKVPSAVRDRASACLKHFVWACDNDIILKALEKRHGTSQPKGKTIKRDPKWPTWAHWYARSRCGCCWVFSTRPYPLQGVNADGWEDLDAGAYWPEKVEECFLGEGKAKPCKAWRKSLRRIV